MAAFYANAPLPDTNARQAAQTIRPSSTALLTIDSEDRYKNYTEARTKATSPYSFSITKNESLMPGFMTRIGVSEVVFPWAIPNINPKTHTINLEGSWNVGVDISSTIISIDEGFYRPGQLATIFETAVQNWLTQIGYGTTISVGYGVNDFPVFTVDASDASGASGSLDLLVFTPLVANTPDYPYPDTNKQLFDLLGFGGSGGNVTITPDVTYTGGVTFCQAIRYIDIVCNQLTNSQAQKDQTSQTVARDMLCRLYIGDAGGSGQSTISPQDDLFCPPGCAPFVIYRNFTMPKQIQWIPNQNIPGFLQFKVYDDAGASLNESVTVTPNEGFGYNADSFNSSDWSMTMLVSEC
jgi:hypothetical protein